MPSIVALVPARSGSKRLPGKNTKLLGGRPLLAWTIEAAKAAGIFSDILVSSEDSGIGLVGATYGAEWWPRRAAFAMDSSPDIEWVQEVMEIRCGGVDAFAILRPTSPFRSAATIRAGWESLNQTYGHNKPVFDSVRAVTEYEGYHPAKLWYPWGKRITCIKPYSEGKHEDGTPWHSSPTQSLKSVWKQTGGLEMAWTRVLKETGTISGTRVHPLILGYPENIDINTEDDWQEAERIATTLARD